MKNTEKTFLLVYAELVEEYVESAISLKKIRSHAVITRDWRVIKPAAVSRWKVKVSLQ